MFYTLMQLSHYEITGTYLEASVCISLSESNKAGCRSANMLWVCCIKSHSEINVTAVDFLRFIYNNEALRRLQETRQIKAHSTQTLTSKCL